MSENTGVLDDVLRGAALGVDPERCKILVGKNKTAMSQVDYNGDTMLHLAAMKGNKEIVDFLLENGADPLTKDKFGATALHLAAITGHDNTVKSLTDSPEGRITINSQDNKGDTALILAARKGHTDTVKILLERGANPSLTNKQKESATTLATPKCKQMIEDHRRKFEANVAESKHPDTPRTNNGKSSQQIL
jgi:ankyrin repeat protein